MLIKSTLLISNTIQLWLINFDDRHYSTFANKVRMFDTRHYTTLADQLCVFDSKHYTTLRIFGNKHYAALPNTQTVSSLMVGPHIW